MENSIVALAELVRAAADRLDAIELHVARDLRVRATKHTVDGIQGLLELTR